MEYIIRECVENDLPELVALCEAHARFESEVYIPEGKEALLRAALFTRHPKLYCFVIECNKKLQGYFSYTFDYATWDAQPFLYLDCLYLEPAFRGAGIGEVIFGKLREIAGQNQCINIQWQTPVFNERAIKFYNRIGGTGKEKLRFFIKTKLTERS